MKLRSPSFYQIRVSNVNVVFLGGDVDSLQMLRMFVFLLDTSEDELALYRNSAVNAVSLLEFEEIVSFQVRKVPIDVLGEETVNQIRYVLVGARFGILPKINFQ